MSERTIIDDVTAAYSTDVEAVDIDDPPIARVVVARLPDEQVLCVTVGLTQLDGDPRPGPLSGWGRELTMRAPVTDQDRAVRCLVDLAAQLVRSRVPFEVGDETELDDAELSFAFFPDPSLAPRATRRGRFEYLRVVGGPVDWVESLIEAEGGVDLISRLDVATTDPAPSEAQTAPSARGGFGEPGPFERLHAAHRPAGVAGTGSGPSAFRRVRIGALPLRSGRWLVVDPDDLVRQEPFDLRVPPGDHPVFVTLCRPAGREPGEPGVRERVAFATLQLSDEAPDTFFGYAAVRIDTGTCAFFDADAWAAWHDFKRAHRAAWSRVACSMTGKPFAEAHEGDHRLLLFESGPGDGTYDVFTATRRGQLVAIIVDFGLLRGELR